MPWRRSARAAPARVRWRSGRPVPRNWYLIVPLEGMTRTTTVAEHSEGINEPRFRVLGPVAAFGDDGRRLPLGGLKHLSVLAMLLLSANQVVAEDRLLALVWGDRPSGRGRLRLQVIISELRSVLGHARIIRVNDGYLINIRGPGELDLQIFTDLVDEATGELAGGRAQAASDLLRAALALWTGPPLGGVSDALIEYGRARLEERRLAALEELFEAEITNGRHAQIIGELHRIITAYPFRERLAAQLMLALARCERRAEALSVYAEARERLVEELGIEPGQRLRDIQARILNDELHGPPPRPATKELVPVWIPPAQLPRDVWGFAGRQDVLTGLDNWLTDRELAVCVVSGVAGVGKSALAVHWAHKIRDQFPDGQLYVDLRGYDPEEQPKAADTALTQLLRALRVDPSDLPTEVDELAGLYRSLLAGRRVLVVLDNARDVAQVLPLLPPSGVVVVTSRHRLGELVALWGAHAMTLDSLADVEAHALLRAVLGPDRLAAEPAAALDLIRLCAGLPLALRIAAANVVHASAHNRTPITALAAELVDEDRLAALALDGTEQSAVTAAFAASYRALTPQHQRLFRLLGLMPGPDFTPAASAALAAIPISQARRHLQALTAAHMIENHAAGRYRFHDLVRLYAKKQAQADPDRTPAWGRLVEHYLNFAASAAENGGASIMRLRPERAAELAVVARSKIGDLVLAELPTEMPNLIAAASHAAQQGPYPAAWFLADYVRTCMYRHGRKLDWLRIAPTILSAAQRHQERDVQAMLHYSIGWFTFRIGQRSDWGDSKPPDALHHITEAIRLAGAISWRECEAAARNVLGWALTWSGHPAEAVTHTEKALVLFSEVGSMSGEGYALRTLGAHHHHLGDAVLAEDYYRQALHLSERQGSPLSRASALRHLGSIRIFLGRLSEAEEDLNQACDIYDKLRSYDGLAASRLWLVRLHWEAGEFDRAHDEARHLLALIRERGGKIFEATVLGLLADTEVELARFHLAGKHINLAQNIVAGTHFSWHIAAVAYVLTRVKTGVGEYSSAVDEANRALTIARDAGYRSIEPLLLRALTEAYARWGKHDLATATGREGLGLCQKTHYANEERRIRRLLEDSTAGETAVE